MLFDILKGFCLFQGKPARLFIVTALVLLHGACASSPAMTGKGTAQSMEVVPVEKTGLFRKTPADTIMLNEGIFWLGLQDRPPDYVKARETFVVLTKTYPLSKWLPLTETFIHLIDKIQSLQAKGLSEQGLAERLRQDNEQLKKDIEELGSKFQAERNHLFQENERLKKDIELLKQLEVQLDKRNKMLR